MQQIKLQADGLKVLVVSDLHLTDDFELKKYHHLLSLIEAHDLVVLNGDFWDGYQIKYIKFLTSAWAKLFPVLLAKKAIFLYGNHDQLKYCSGAEFSVAQADQLTITQKGEIFQLEHGNRIDPNLDQKIYLPRFILGFGNRLEGLAFKLKGPAFLQKYQSENRIIIDWRMQHMPDNEWLVCGHTHLATEDHEFRYANSGIFNWGMAQYLTIENGKVILTSDKY